MDLKERKEYMLQLIREFCEDTDYSKDQRYRFRDDYAGRGMFGRTCVGIVCDDPVRAGMELTAYLAENATDGEYNTYDHLMSCLTTLPDTSSRSTRKRPCPTWRNWMTV